MTGADDGAPRDSDAAVLRRALVICNKRGLHARAAAKFVTLAERFGASVEVEKDGQSVSARSIMGLMMLGAGLGATISVSAEGWDAKEALDALSALVEAGFHEQD
ncbi:MAG: HPr family phosphocarrier protein [Acetobacteraceae bacterium]|nr:HPr family phosphocarrier protein [Acetobacteraceae bacterium]